MPLPDRAIASEVAVAHETARAIRIGGQTISPGEGRVVPVALPDRTDVADAIPVWVVAGAHPGARVTIIGAPRGFEVGAARVCSRLRTIIDPAALHGGLVVVPVLRPGGRFAARGQALRRSAAWRFPGDPGGNRQAREAFAVFSELVVGSSLVVSLTSAEPGLTAAFTVQGSFDNPRVRRLSLCTSALAAVNAKPAVGSLAAAASEMGAIALELCGPGEVEGDEPFITAVIQLLASAGSVPARSVQAAALARLPATERRAPTPIAQQTIVRASAGGLLEQAAKVGGVVGKGELLARIVPPLLGRVGEVVAPHDGIVLQATVRAGTRARAPLFVIGRVTRAFIAREQKKVSRRANGAPPPETVPVPLNTDTHPLQVGWVERVSLPSLGVDRVRAKIDTGARTSALHVARMAIVGNTEGPHRRPILELTLPAGARRGAPPATVRVLVREYVQVKDTSGRTERRPVIETTLRLGTHERRIRVTLTNRGDMRFPLLIGRTALGPGVVVDPARRLLLPQQREPRLSSPARAAVAAAKAPVAARPIG